jgi:hypothetical protein
MAAASPPWSDLTLVGLARAWADQVSQSTYLAMSGAEIEQLLIQMTGRLATAVARAPVDKQAAREVAAELVAHDLTGSRSIGCSIEVLGEGLPRPHPVSLPGLTSVRTAPEERTSVHPCQPPSYWTCSAPGSPTTPARERGPRILLEALVRQPSGNVSATSRRWRANGEHHQNAPAFPSRPG